MFHTALSLASHSCQGTKRTNGTCVFYRQARALALMGKGSMHGIAEEHYPAAAPPGQAWQISKSPEIHVPFDVAHEVEDAAIPGVSREYGKRLIAETASGRRLVRFVRAGRSYLSSSDPRVLFGLGAEKSIKKLTIYWPSGNVQVVNDVPVGRYVKVEEK